MRTSDGASTVTGCGRFVVDGGEVRLLSDDGNVFGSETVVELKSGSLEIYEKVNAFGGKSLAVSGGKLSSDLSNLVLDVSNFTFSGGTIDLAGFVSDAVKANSTDWSGMLHENGNITVYGSQLLSQDLEISNGKVLTISNGANLESSGVITNHGEIINNGTVINNGTITNDGTVINYRSITNNGTVTNNGSITNDGTIDSISAINNVTGNSVNIVSSINSTPVYVAGTDVSGGGYWLVVNNALKTDGANEDNYNVSFDTDTKKLILKDLNINRDASGNPKASINENGTDAETNDSNKLGQYKYIKVTVPSSTTPDTPVPAVQSVRLLRRFYRQRARV